MEDKEELEGQENAQNDDHNELEKNFDELFEIKEIPVFGKKSLQQGWNKPFNKHF